MREVVIAFILLFTFFFGIPCFIFILKNCSRCDKKEITIYPSYETIKNDF